jgi:class 3 adenylate cyclase
MTMRKTHTSDDEDARFAAFLEALVGDVIVARQRLSAADAQTTRRDVVRASLAAIEGMTWTAREHVREALAQLEELTPVADLALREMSYTVSDRGELVEQVRGLPLLTILRLVVSQAKIISPEISVQFSGRGWSDLRQAVQIRNRITHPKSDLDLEVCDSDLAAVEAGLFWLQATVEYLMASINLALVRYKDQLSEFVQRLKAGDPEALALYHSKNREIHGD